MRPQFHFLLIYIGAIGFGCFNKCVSTQSCLPIYLNGTGCSDEYSPHIGPDAAGMCKSSVTQSACFTSTSSTVRRFLQCVGLPVIMSENSVDHMRNLRGVIDTALDVYSFMRSSFSQGHIMELSGGIGVNAEAEQFHDLDFVKLWLQVKLKPLLLTVTRQFLSCLSGKDFSCETYQAVVKELSTHFSNMDPVRQRWIYMFFMYPFLARNGTAGCVATVENSEDWLMKNFGSFSALAYFKDFTALNIMFSGLEVLHLLTPEQKAELILNPEVGGLDNGTVNLVFESLTKPQENQHMDVSRPFHNLTTSAPILYGAMPNQQTAFNGFLVFLKPLGSVVKQFVSLTHQKNLTSLKSSTLAQSMINWTLAELAGFFPQNITVENEIKPIQPSSLGNFDITEIDDWFQQVVTPVLKRFLPDDQTEIPEDLTAVFYRLFSLNSNLNVSESDAPDECSVTTEEYSCAIPSAVENLAYVLQCVGQTNLTITEENMSMLVIELSKTLNSLVEQYSTLNSNSADADFMDLFGQFQTDSFTKENLQDAEYIKLWFQLKLKPLLPSVSKDFLVCLSNKNFTCETFQVIVSELSDNILLMDEMRQQLIYSHFIHPFLLRHNYTDPSCVSSSSSLQWLMDNIGVFSVFAPLQDFYDFHSNFSALEALPALSTKQMAKLVASPESEPSQKDVVISTVFEHLLESPKERNLTGFLHYLLLFSTEELISCESYNIILGRLDLALPSVPRELEPVVQTSMTELTQSAPEDCILGNFKCPMTPNNESRVCTGVNSTELQHYLDTGNITNMLCNFSIGQYACSSLMQLGPENLVMLLKCKLPNHMIYSKETWKVFLTKVSEVLDQALGIFSNMSFHITSPSMTNFLDILGELRINEFSDVQLADVDLINIWFLGHLRPFLSSVSEEFLHCLGSKNFSCETYQKVMEGFSLQFPLMEQMRWKWVAQNFITPFLIRNSSDLACVGNTNGSLDWLHKNFGPFSVILSLDKLQTFNQNFDPLEALSALSAKQMAELVTSPESEPSQKDVIINKVFDHLLESPKKRNLTGFLHYLLLFSTEKSNSCDSYHIILRRLDLALPSVPRELEPVIRASINELTQRAPEDCIPEDSECPMTLYNETRVCARVNSTELQHYLDTGPMTNMLCNFSIGQYACSSLMQLGAENLATLLKCKLPSNMTYSNETWKMFLTKVSHVLDEALHIFSNMSSHITSLSASQFLDILGEMRMNELSDAQLADVDLINKWFHGNLRPLLSSVSGEFLRCLGTKNFSCETYQQVVKEFSSQFPQMDQMRQKLVSKYFILPILFRNTSDPACVSSSNGSVDWLHKNFGPFSVLVPLETLLILNQDFVQLEVLPFLSAMQMAELVAFLHTALPHNEVTINAVFDFLLKLPDQSTFKDFLHYLIPFSREKMINCDSYKTIFSRLYQALPLVPQELEPDIWTSINELMKTAPGDCLPDLPGCSLTPQNETRVCADVNSSELQHYLDTGNITEELCHFHIEQYACSSLIHFTAENLVSLLKCKLSSNKIYSKESWKLFLTKASGVLNQALHIFSNMSFHITSPSMSHFLEILGEIRIDRFSHLQLEDVDFINKWFHRYLRPFLSSVSGEFLRCLNTKNISCETYQQVVKEFSFQFPNMTQMRQELVSKYFIIPFLSSNTTDHACVSSINGSEDWLLKNFGPFSVFVPLKTLLKLNQDFVPLETLRFLSAKQMAKLILFPQIGPPLKEIDTVFDYLLESPKESNLKEFLHHLILSSTETSINCDIYKIIFSRLYQALPLVPQELEPVIWTSINELMKTAPVDCMPVMTGCSVTPHNESRICADVDSSELQYYLDSENKTVELCHFPIEEYACSSLINFTAENLVDLLKCELPSNMIYSKETWKVFLTKASGVLNDALHIFSNMSFNFTGPSSSVLDILGEIRIDRFNDVQLADVDFISKWFQGYLRPFLSSVSGEFFDCLNTKNLSCETYQHVLKGLSYQFPNMDQISQKLVTENFILPFLSQNTSDPACLSSTNGSVDWLHKNFGPFSVLVPLKTLLKLNQNFAPLEALPALSAKQMAELVVVLQTAPPQKDVIINTVFDLLLKLPDKRTFEEFLHYLNLFSTETMINCDSYKTIFSRLYQALPLVPQEQEPVIWASINELMKTAPGDCMPDVTGCSLTPHNETRVCADINSSELQHYLDTGNKTDELCRFGIEQYACSSLINFTAENLVDLLKCELPRNMTYSKETWKVFLTKASGVLNDALHIFSNMSFNFTGPSSSVLDILGEIRIDRFNDVQLADVDFISKWFQGYLRPFLSSVSGEFLDCLNTKSLSCETYQHVLKGLSFQFPNMDQISQKLVTENFILPFLSQNTSDPACLSSTNGSVDWLRKNFGPFSVLVPLKILLTLNQEFSPLGALPLLSARQAAELVVIPEIGPQQKVIITVFDHYIQNPENLNEFLQHLVKLSTVANISCDSYKEIFYQLNQALSLVSVELVSTITSNSEALMGIAPQSCLPVVFSGKCDRTPVNETEICAGVNSFSLQHNIWDGSIKEAVCSFSIEEYACISPIGVTAQHLWTLLQCKLNSNVTSSKETWKLFLSKVSGILDEALDLFSNKMANSSNPSTSHVLEVIGEIRIDSFSAEEWGDTDFVKQWFQMKLRPFLPSVSREFLSCLSTKNFSCLTYQAVVKILGEHFAEMDRHQQYMVYTDLVYKYLSQNDTSDPACISSSPDSADWLERNFGSFIGFASIKDFQRLYLGFSPMDALSHLTIHQLSEVASIPGQFKNPEDVNKLMGHVNASDLANFFDTVSPVIQANENAYPSSVRSAMLQQVFDRGSLSDSSVSDAEILVWLQHRLSPLLANLSLSHVEPFFNIVKDKQCVTSQEAVKLLNAIHSTLQSDTQREVYVHILTSLKEPVPLHCYINGSFYLFVERSFLDFQFPNVTTFISLTPDSKRSELLNSIPPSDLRDLLMRPNVVDNNEALCTIFDNYDHAPDFLETQEDIPDDVRRSILPCVWHLALSSENETEVDLWFEKRLKSYLTFLTKDLISSTETLNAKCLPFQKIVFVLGDKNVYNNSDFTEEDVYDTIKTYLSIGTKPKCYDATHPQLNSKAWFANYIGGFITYITLDDLLAFGTSEQLQVFSTNHDNLALFNHSSIPGNVSSHYTELIYLEDANFNPMLLPVDFRCVAPGPAYSQLNSVQSMIILHSLNQSCSEVDPSVSAALAGNFETVNSDVIAALGQESVGLSTGQITSVPPSDIVSSLTTLSSVTGWNQGQSIAIVKMLLKGNFAINSALQLLQLGSLVMGVSSKIIENIASNAILQTSQNPSFVTNILAAPQIIQYTYVNKIISINSNPEILLENVPNAMATEIPRTLLQFSTESFEKINKKKWKYEQAVLFFDKVATGFSDSNEISTTVLQGFSCTRVQTFSRKKVQRLIKACRRRGVVLRETQLTCMYNYIKDFDTDSFQQYPPDMLLYFNYNAVRSNCKAYFSEIGYADFSIFSDTLQKKKSTLFENAKSCLGITGTSINRENVEILGNMCCTLDGSYIENSDSLILEKLKNCRDLSEVQAESVQKTLMTGNTLYGHPSTWNLKTLKDLGILPLYMKSDFWRQFKMRVKRRFFKYFMKARRTDKTERRKLKRLFREYRKSLRSKRAAESTCTVGSITQAVISDDAFPIGYDEEQFNACLSATAVKHNLAGLDLKVDDNVYSKIIMDKLNQAYPKNIPEEVIQVMGSVSRAASVDEINNWNITKFDTLAALMVSDNGEWAPEKSKAILTKYLSIAGNILGTAELNAIGGTYLCTLDTSVLKGIPSSSLGNVNSLNLLNCTIEKKRVLFTTANQAFRTRSTVSLTEYQLMEYALGGAPEDYIHRLAASNVSMDISTFIDLDGDVINALTVENVKSLLGLNLGDLKTFEDHTVIAGWIAKQYQSDLNSLGVNITGGKVDPLPTGVGVITTTLGGGTTITTSGSDGSCAKSSHVLHLLLVLAFTTMQILQ